MHTPPLQLPVVDVTSSVDVIIPCYRYSQFLRQCVRSVLAQTGVSIRLLIIDDASPDDTASVAAELISEDGRVNVLTHASNRGHIATYNEGLAWATATYVLLLSADDYLLPGALARAAQLMGRHPNVAFVFGNVIHLREDGGLRQLQVLKTRRRADQILTRVQFIELNGARNLVATPTAVVRTEMQRRAGQYRPELPHAADMDMWLRLSALGDVGFIDADQAVYRLHNGNMSHAYTASKSLPDVLQRKRVFELLFGTEKAARPPIWALRDRIYRELAGETLALASAAFNDGEFETCDKLAQLALAFSPEAKGSWRWTKLAFKRQIGVRATRGLRTMLDPGWLRHPPTADSRMARNRHS